MFHAMKISFNFFLLIILSRLNSPKGFLNFGFCKLIADDSCDNDYVKFFLYTRNNTQSPQTVSIKPGSDNLTASYFKRDSSNKIIIHGYNADSKNGFLLSIKDEYLKSKDANVWMLDWAAIATCYPLAIVNTRHAGRCLARFIERISNSSTNEDLHVIGFSLGAHVPGSASVFLDSYMIPRVTGLDPASPLIGLLDSDHRLNPSSGRFVDVLHTNGLQQGQLLPSGHVDFYFNGGLTQPGCSNLSVAESLHCSHHRAVEFFAESINSPVGFRGSRCPANFLPCSLQRCSATGPTEVLVGEHVLQATRGCFAVTTKAERPYALG